MFSTPIDSNFWLCQKRTKMYFGGPWLRANCFHAVALPRHKSQTEKQIRHLREGDLSTGRVCFTLAQYSGDEALRWVGSLLCDGQETAD